MKEQTFSATWKSSTQARKQHLFRYTAPLHVKQKLMHVHLSPDLRQKYGFRNILIRKGDKVKILRGEWKRKEGKIERVDLKREHIFVAGVDTIKKDGTKVPYPVAPSNVMILELDLADKRRKKKLESKKHTETKQKET